MVYSPMPLVAPMETAVTLEWVVERRALCARTQGRGTIVVYERDLE
jgi:hypothetical protein